MEERPSDSQNESANELPQSVSPTPLIPDQRDDAPRSEPVSVSGSGTTNPGVSEPATNESVAGTRVVTDRIETDDTQETQSPDGEDLRAVLNQPRHRNQPSEGGPAHSPNPSGHEKPRQERPGQERQRDGQPRQHQSGQSPKQGQPGNERPGHERQRDPNQLRQKNNPAGQERPGQEKQPRDPNQPQKQNQTGQERQGQERPGSDKPREPRPNQQSRVPNQPRPERPPRESRPMPDMEMDDRDDDDRIIDTRPPDRLTTGPREETTRETDGRLMIGITLGDYNGIGPEVILKALQNNRLQKICTPVIYGSMRVLNRYRNLLEMKDWNLNGIQQVGQASHKLTNVITCWPDQNQEIQPGKVTAEAGQAAFACLARAVDDLREGRLDAIVTAPINKHNIQSEEFKFPGHTEYLAEAFSVADNLMFLVSERLRVGVVTGHVPLGKVRQNVTRERILQKFTMMSQSLRLDFGIDKPRIAVLGLNPHAGEEGLLGNEEQEIVKPLIKQLQDKGNLVYGPFPADGFFGTRAYLKFDAVLAMYHDQGLIPFKAIAFEDGVNFTAAMPVVRTSPDHGTAYDIAGKNLADETSMLQAIYTACDIARRRRETAEIQAGALKPKRERALER